MCGCEIPTASSTYSPTYFSLTSYLLEQHSDHEGAAEAGGLPDKGTVMTTPTVTLSGPYPHKLTVGIAGK
eukprot:scaffold3127_cov60-Phaeocystis_antarctica.AAC.2